MTEEEEQVEVVGGGGERQIKTFRSTGIGLKSDVAVLEEAAGLLSPQEFVE